MGHEVVGVVTYDNSGFQTGERVVVEPALGCVARGIALVLAYCLGLGIPFVLLAFGSARAVQGLGWLRRHTRTIQIFGGVLLLIVGTALVNGVWNDFVAWVRDGFVSDVRLPI